MFKFKALSFRKNYEDVEGQWAYYTAIVDLRDVPAELEDWRKVNLRDPNVKGDVYNAIIGTIKNTPESFLRKNRGITILADSVELNKANDQLNMRLVDVKLHGIVDGGHTFTAIKEARNETTNGYVTMHIMTGITDLREVVDIVDARNRSRSAQSQSLDNLAGVYEPIKAAISGLSYENKVSYSEYEVDDEKKRKPISIREILSYIYVMNPEDHATLEDHPIAAYSGKGLVVDYFSPPATDAAKTGATGGKGYEDNVIEKAAPLLPSLLAFVDFLYKEIPAAYNGKEEGRFGALTTMGVRRKSVQLHFGGVEADYDYPDAFLYPVLAAFRHKLEVKDGKWQWKDNQDPAEVWVRCKEGLGARLRQIVEQSPSANKLGKSNMNWTFIADAIR